MLVDLRPSPTSLLTMSPTTSPASGFRGWVRRLFGMAGWLGLVLFAPAVLRGEIIIAEGEKFSPQDAKGWKVTHQDDSYASHTYGGMWVTHGGLLGAPAAAENSVATQTVTVAQAGQFRVWSKYQAPPFFNYLHKIEIVQKGKTVYSHIYGKKGTERLWSFSGESDELWWPWGVDHDCAEAPASTATLAAGSAEIRLTAVPNAAPAADRFIDFIVLTTDHATGYQGFKPYSVGSPFTNEAFAASQFYIRFLNTAPAASQLTVTRAGHYQPQYGGGTTKIPEQPVASGQWSPWVNIGPFCRLVHDEGLWLTLPNAPGPITVQFSRDAAGIDIVGDVKLTSGDAVSVPIDITWRKESRVRASRDIAKDIIAQRKTWRIANGGKKPKDILFWGSFASQADWVMELKDALGYNTQLSGNYDKTPWDGLHQHFGSPAALQGLAKSYKGDLANLRFVSFGDEIHLGEINYKDPANQVKFREWLKKNNVTAADLGMAPDQATLSKTASSRIAWYSNLFNEEERFAVYRQNTEVARQVLGKHVLTGANYSPHHLALCYGPIYQWVDIFKHNGMSMFWGEDYIFSVPEAPQMISWMFAQMRCAVKYNGQPIHFYVMPHAPGQLPGFLRRNMLCSVGYGARHIDSFWVAPAENFTENYVSWNYPDTFRTIAEAIYDTAEAEKLQTTGKVRPARVALVTGKATDFNESRLMVDKDHDPLARICRNAPRQLNQILCRKDQQLLYLALKHAQHAVDLITEDDIVDRDELKNYDVVYFAGEWVDHRAVKKLDAWVQAGGVLYACAGIGHKNEFDEPEAGMTKILGLKGSTLAKNTVVIRTYLELPLLAPIDTITFDGQKIPAIGMKQQLQPDKAKVLGTWSDGSAAVTVHEYGKGKAFAVGTLAGNSYMKTALRLQPFARGGRKTVYNPVDFDPAATRLARLGVDAKTVSQAVVCSRKFIEAAVIDHPQGTLVTLLNWSDTPAEKVEVSVVLPFAPKTVRTVTGQKTLPSQYADGKVTFTVDIADADYILLLK